MKDSKEKEHRISNLKDLISNVKEDPVDEALSIKEYSEEEDAELINYLNEDRTDYSNLEIDDEFIYHPGDEKDYAINLEEEIDENFIIKTKIPEENPEEDEDTEKDDFIDEFGEELSENIDNLINAKIGKTPVLAIVSSILGVLLIITSVFVYNSGTDRIIDNVVSGETTFIMVILLIIGLLLLIYGLYRIFNFKNPLENMVSSIDSIDNEEKKEEVKNTPEPAQKIIPKSNIPLDKESYKIGEFDIGDLKKRLKKPTISKSKMPEDENIDEIPPAKEKPKEKKGLTNEELEEIEYTEVQLDGESIDDIFAEVEDIEDIPIISLDSEEKN